MHVGASGAGHWTATLDWRRRDVSWRRGSYPFRAPRKHADSLKHPAGCRGKPACPWRPRGSRNPTEVSGAAMDFAPFRRNTGMLSCWGYKRDAVPGVAINPPNVLPYLYHWQHFAVLWSVTSVLASRAGLWFAFAFLGNLQKARISRLPFDR